MDQSSKKRKDISEFFKPNSKRRPPEEIVPAPQHWPEEDSEPSFAREGNSSARLGPFAQIYISCRRTKHTKLPQ